VELPLGNVAQLVSAAVALIGVLVGLRQLQRYIRVQRAQFLLATTERYFGDQEVRRLYYDIDYGRFEITFEKGVPVKVTRGDSQPKDFIGGDEERLLDSLLYTFDTIGRIVKVGALSRKEARVFAFQAKRVLSNSAVRKYLDWVNEQRKLLGGEVPAHAAADILAVLAPRGRKEN